MGVDTRLLVSSKWDLGSIQEVLENHLELVERRRRVKVFGGDKKTRIKRYKVEISSCHDTSPGMFQFWFQLEGSEHGRMMYVHTNHDTPLGPATMLSLGHDEESVKIMRTVAEVLGGFFEENDCAGDLEQIQGKLWMDDGLQYYLKQGVIENKITDSHDKQGLADFIEEWDKKHRR